MCDDMSTKPKKAHYYSVFIFALGRHNEFNILSKGSGNALKHTRIHLAIVSRVRVFGQLFRLAVYLSISDAASQL